MREITMGEAIREAMREEMLRDPKVFLIGEDIGVYGGAFGVTLGLVEEFGEERVRSTPISEAVIVGAATGAAVMGMRPVAEIMFQDFATLAMDQLVNQAAKIRYMFGGKARVPLVLRAPIGSGTGAAAQHSQSLENWYAHVPGLKVVVPSTPADAKGLLKTAIRDDNPVCVFEPKTLYKVKGPVPDGESIIPFGQADIKRPGKDCTLFAYGSMVPRALQAAEKLAAEGIEAEVVDPRTLYPFDAKTLIESVKKTGRLVIVHEAVKRSGFGGEVAAVIADSEAFDYLDAPIKRVAGKEVPIPYNRNLEAHAVPLVEDIVVAVKEVCYRNGR